ncbi:hypothetical protein KGM48_00950 [Patescibacteria group bacterium]|nr:hypothetical protein [Patescibacteria group bacterium]
MTKGKLAARAVLVGLMIWIIATVVAVCVATGARAAETPWKWEHFGAAPYATTRGEAMATRESAFRALGYPKKVVELLVEATKSPGEGVELKNGDRFAAQMSKGGVVHGLKEGGGVVAFEKPVRGMRYVADAEMWQVSWEGRVYTLVLPEVCYNWTRMQVEAPPPATKQIVAEQKLGPITVLPATCPNVYFLKVNVWEHSALELPGVAQTHAKEEWEEQFIGVPHVSRTHGGEFRKALSSGQIARSKIPHNFLVSLIMTPEAQVGEPTITKEQVLGEISVTGLYELQFSRKQIESWDAIRVVDVKGDVTSPPRYHATGLHELRFFNHFPGTKLGEWDSNPVPDCIMNEHWIE